MKENKGVTLVVLAITIIILIILAGITITSTIGESGIINKSKSEAAKYDAEIIRKNVKFAALSAAIHPIYSFPQTLDRETTG